MSQKKRVLYISHSHPDFSCGGAEYAAYGMYQSMKASPGYEPFFLARYDKTKHHHPGSNLMRHESDDHVHLLPTNSANYDYFFNTFAWDGLEETEDLHHAFRQLLESLRPQVIHFHHYLHMGVELIAFAKSLLPDVKIVMTLHEFIPICANRGSMIKTQTNQLCLAASPLQCRECFPNLRPSEFFLRERFFKSNLAHVDRFIAPSSFLQSRFVEWGLDADRFLQIDNGRPTWSKRERPPRHQGQPFQVAFFGQIVFHKGVDVLMRAAAEYRRRKAQAQEIGDDPLPEVRFAVHGTTVTLDDEELRNTLEELTQECKDVLHVHGPYDAGSMQPLLSRVDCVVVPSKWWENSPLVIQEAFMAGVPVICSNIGGMAEKVADRVNGLHFVVGNHFDLLDRVLELAVSPELCEELARDIPKILSDVQMAASMQQLYDELTEKV